MFVLEIGRALSTAGHEICVFSSVGGEVSQAIDEEEGMTFVTSPEDCPFVPDLIHGQHHLETMASVATFPGVPAIYQVHGFGPWEEEPPRHPRLLRYFGTTPRMAEWIASRCGVEESEVGTIRNFFDPERFRVVRKSGTGARRAAVMMNHMEESRAAFQALREGCARAGWELDGIGKDFGHVIERPEEVLPGYEVVFAGGRSAIEAMACGCVSIPITRETMAEAVRPDNFERLRDLNFCADAKDPPIASSRVERTLGSLDPAETAQVTERIRREARLEDTIGDLVRNYREIVEEARSHPIPTPEEEAEAMARYLCELASYVKDADGRRLRLGESRYAWKARAAKWKAKARANQLQLQWLEREFRHGSWWRRRLWSRCRKRWERESGEDRR